MFHAVACALITSVALAQEAEADAPSAEAAPEADRGADDDVLGEEDDDAVTETVGERAQEDPHRLLVGTGLAAGGPTLAWWVLVSSVPVLFGVLAAGTGVVAMIVSNTVEPTLAERGQTPVVVAVRAAVVGCILAADASLVAYMVAVFAYPLVNLLTSVPVAIAGAQLAWWVAHRWAGWRLPAWTVTSANLLPYLVLAAGGSVVGMLVGAPLAAVTAVTGAYLVMFAAVLMVLPLFGSQPVADPWLLFCSCGANAVFCGLLPVALTAAVGPLIHGLAALLGHVLGGAASVVTAVERGRPRVRQDPPLPHDRWRVPEPPAPGIDDEE